MLAGGDDDEPLAEQRQRRERGVIDLVGIVGYFTTISMVLNVARTPANEAAEPLPAFPR